MNKFENKVAVITGAATGIGYEIARQLVTEGASVVLNDVDAALAEESAQKIQAETGGICLPFAGDAGNVEAVYALVDFAVKKLGQIDIVIPNAGITLFGDFFSFTPESFQKVTNLNLQGAFFLTQAAAKQMKKQGTGGKVLLMSSTIGYQGFPFLTTYAMSKAALRMMAKSLVVELSPYHITINALAPGATLTERTLLEDEDYVATWSKLIPLNKIGSTQDMAKTALFLVSDDASHITGQTLLVDGGWTSVSPLPPPPIFMTQVAKQ